MSFVFALGFIVSPQPCEGAGCILIEDREMIFGYTQCYPQSNVNCYECWYADTHNGGFNHCFEDPSGEISHCTFQEEMQPDPPDGGG